MAPAYIVGQIDITDMAAYERYRDQVPATVAQYGGEYLVRGGRHEGLEGDAPRSRMVMLKFPSYEQAQAWYNSAEYKPLAELRQSASDGQLVLVEGVD
jgi:uncharacterized protein (DUF1330 family)